MFVTSTDQRHGLLVAIITGGRPALKQRPTVKHIEDLRAIGPADVVWVVSEKDAPGYERDGRDLVTYPRDWAYSYAAEHWMGTTPPDPQGFYGAFPGREWACLEAERRGCWGVLQLDDNITRLTVCRGTGASTQTVAECGGLGMFADLLAALTLSTNARTVGAAMEASCYSRSDAERLIRAGFPYSLFVEQVGAGREHWFGPFEDDITHSFQYGDRADGVTAAVVPYLRYKKEHQSKTGMRAKYDPTRSVQLQRLIPQGAKLTLRATRANGHGDPRVFHTMGSGSIRNPVRVSDPTLYKAAAARMGQVTQRWYAAERAANRAKVQQRLANYIARTG